MSKKIALCSKPSEFFRERITEVMERHKLSASEVAEFYLVDLLERFMLANNLKNQNEPLAFLFLRAQQAGLIDSQKIKILKQLGDTSLYVSGFFSDSLNRKVIDLDYYREMGAIAYRSLSETIREPSFHDLYNELHSKFNGFAEVLSIISHEFLAQDESKHLHLLATPPGLKIKKG